MQGTHGRDEADFFARLFFLFQERFQGRNFIEYLQNLTLYTSTRKALMPVTSIPVIRR